MRQKSWPPRYVSFPQHVKLLPYVLGPVRKIDKLLTRTLKPTNEPNNAGVITLSHIGRVIRQTGVLEHVGVITISRIGKVLRQTGVLEHVGVITISRIGKVLRQTGVLEHVGVITISRIGKVLRQIGMMDHSVRSLSVNWVGVESWSLSLCGKRQIVRRQSRDPSARWPSSSGER